MRCIYTSVVLITVIITIYGNRTIPPARGQDNGYPFPPESLDTINFCAEKCKHIKDMCTGLYEKESFPAPKCLKWSYALAEDQMYPHQYKPNSNAFIETKLDFSYETIVLIQLFLDDIDKL